MAPVAFGYSSITRHVTGWRGRAPVALVSCRLDYGRAEVSIISPPLFIVSTGRCGSTLFLEMLDAHPCVAGIREFWSYRPNRL